MKKLKICLFALLAVGESAVAQTVTVADVEAIPGETVSFSLNLSGGRADSYTALSFDAQFPASGFTTTGVYSVSASWPGASAVVGEVDGTGLATIPFASASPIQGSAVEGLVTVSFKVDESVASGNYDVTLKNIMFEYGTSDKDYASNVTFKVNVVSVETVTLYEDSPTAPQATTNRVNVTVNRTINANEWSTICLPFDMTASQVTTAFGTGVQLRQLSSWSFEGEPTAAESFTLNFTPITTITKNVPCLIKVTDAINSFDVDGVVIDPIGSPGTAAVTYSKGEGWDAVDYTARLYGFYTATTVPNKALFLSGNQLWYSKGNTNIKAFRGVFWFANVVLTAYNTPNAARVTLNFDDEATGISNRLAESESDIFYNLQGQRVDAPAGGIFIRNGKKVIIK